MQTKFGLSASGNRLFPSVLTGCEKTSDVDAARADARQENPQKALELFQKVVTLEAEKGSEIKWRFKALEHLVRIHFQLRDFDQMLQVGDETSCRALSHCCVMPRVEARVERCTLKGGTARHGAGCCSVFV